MKTESNLKNTGMKDCTYRRSCVESSLNLNRTINERRAVAKVAFLILLEKKVSTKDAESAKIEFNSRMDAESILLKALDVSSRFPDDLRTQIITNPEYVRLILIAKSNISLSELHKTPKILANQDSKKDVKPRWNYFRYLAEMTKAVVCMLRQPDAFSFLGARDPFGLFAKLGFSVMSLIIIPDFVIVCIVMIITSIFCSAETSKKLNEFLEIYAPVRLLIPFLLLLPIKPVKSNRIYFG